MAINDHSINSYAVNGDLLEFRMVAAGQLISIEQAVMNIGSGELISIEQDVELKLSMSVSEALISIEQVVETTYSGSIISIEQRVINTSIPSHLSRTGWDLTLTINGREIPTSQIHGMIDIERAENDAALMTVTLLPAAGIQDIESYHGKQILLDAHTSSGTTRLYTGTVDIPDIDLIEEKITLHCTDRRTELLNNQLPGLTDTIGVWSSHIFREPKDTAGEVEQRLSTTPYAVDFDAYGNFTITPWATKTTADFTLTDSDVYRNKPRVELTSRGRVINKVSINLDYRYERFYHITRGFSWTSPISDSICYLLLDGYSLTFKSAVLSAIDSAGWPIKGEVTFVPIHESGWYRCEGLDIMYSTVQLQGVNESVTDASGNQVTDSSGNPVYKTRITGGTQYGGLYCMGASWYATQQWSQSVTEKYSITMQAPQSQSQFGTIESDINYSIDEEADAAGWDNYTTYNNYSETLNYYIDQDLKRNEFNTAVDVALQQAKTTILGSHRDTRVYVDTFLWPEVDLKHTVLVDTDEVEAKGKVYNIRHKLNIGTGEAVTTTTLVLSRAQGSASSSTLTIPSKPSDNITYNTQVIYLGNHFGEDPTTAAAASWNGMIGNKWVTENNNSFRTTYQEQFIVDAPAISSSQRDAKELAGSANYNLEIPNDTLVITFDGIS